ncbi:MAG: hypothetical protein FWD78_04695 [Treponema sp.]|nr:hypothetical protein [Treponema sp.]
MGKEKNKRICQPFLVLCEGEDTTQFIIRYLEYLQKNDKLFENFQALDFGGNEELPIFLSDLPNYPGFDIVQTIIILRDAEGSHDDAVKSIINALKKSTFPVPPEPNKIEHKNNLKLAYSLFPSLSTINKNGTLEDLYINNLAENGVKDVLNDIYSFINNLKAKGRIFTWLHKTLLHTYFSVTNDFVSKKIGQATGAGAFNFECNEINMLKDLMKNIAST